MYLNLFQKMEDDQLSAILLFSFLAALLLVAICYWTAKLLAISDRNEELARISKMNNKGDFKHE